MVEINREHNGLKYRAHVIDVRRDPLWGGIDPREMVHLGETNQSIIIITLSNEGMPSFQEWHYVSNELLDHLGIQGAISFVVEMTIETYNRKLKKNGKD